MPLNPRYKQLFKTAAKDGFYEAVVQLPQPTPEQIREIIAILITAPFVLRAIMVSPDRRLPQVPRGRAYAFTQEQKRDAHVELATLLALGVEKRDAMNRVAQNYQLSDKTIERFWFQNKGFEESTTQDRRLRKPGS